MALHADRAAQRLGGGTRQTKERGFLGTRTNEELCKPQECSHVGCFNSNADGSGKVLANPVLTTLHMTETCLILSPGVPPIVGSNRARIFGDTRASRVPPPPQGI